MNGIFFVELLVEDILRFHLQLENSNIPVDKGVRDLTLLESAVHVPFQTFDGKELYPSIHEKAARLLFGIANNHAFIDGNKRTAVHAMEMFLQINGYVLDCSDTELENIVVGVADNTYNCDDLLIFLRKYTKIIG